MTKEPSVETKKLIKEGGKMNEGDKLVSKVIKGSAEVLGVCGKDKNYTIPGFEGAIEKIIDFIVFQSSGKRKLSDVPLKMARQQIQSLLSTQQAQMRDKVKGLKRYDTPRIAGDIYRYYEMNEGIFYKVDDVLALIEEEK